MSFGADGQWVAIGWLRSAKGCRAGFSLQSWSWRCHRRPAGHGVRVPVSGYAVARDRSDREAAGRISNWASLTAAVAIVSYAVNLQLSRVYVVIALPSITVFDLCARYGMRKQLHRQRAAGKCLHSVRTDARSPSTSSGPWFWTLSSTGPS